MDIIVRGEPHEIDFVRRLCRDKVRRGVLAILPATSPACDDVVKLRNERDETTKENERLKERVAQLENQLANVDSNVESNVESNVDTSAEKVASVPKNDENVPNSTESASVESDSQTPYAMDNKHIDTEDLQEVDLDADDKNLSGEDSKTVQTDHTEEPASVEKTSRRSKKTE